MKVYTLSKGWKIFFIFFASLLILGFLYYLLAHCIYDIMQEPNSLSPWLFMGGALLLIVLMSCTIVEAIKGKFVIDTDKIYQQGIITNKELLLAEIKGYRVDDKYIYIEPLTREKKKIKISTYFSGVQEVVYWLNERYPDLDEQEKEEQQELILTDDTYGMTKEERIHNLDRAKKVAKVLNILGIVLAVVLFLFREIDMVSIPAAILAPLVFVLILKMHKGLITIDQKKTSPYPSIFWGFFGIIAALFLRSLIAYDILDYEGIWKPAFLITGLFFSFLVIGTPEFKSRKVADLFLFGFIFVVMFAYAFGVIVTVNCGYDDSTPSQHNAKVLEKWINSSKSKSYHLKLSQWDPRVSSGDVEVSSEMYESVNTEEQINIYLFQGRLKIPWFIVTEK